MLPSRCFVRTAALVLSLLAPTASLAQTADEDPERRPIRPFAADVRGVVAKYPTDITIAPFLGVTADNIAKRGLGFALGAHVYPIRGRKMSLGLGGEMMFSRGGKTIQVASATDATKKVDGPTVEAKLSSVLPQVSLNFGRHDGWSYVSGGIGWSKYSTNVKDTTGTAPATAVESDQTKMGTIHYGGGARWFAKPHLAFSFDVRYYIIKAQPATTTLPALGRKRLIMLSAGISVG
jgi:opacity protein-like surface antigen